MIETESSTPRLWINTISFMARFNFQFRTVYLAIVKYAHRLRGALLRFRMVKTKNREREKNQQKQQQINENVSNTSYESLVQWELCQPHLVLDLCIQQFYRQIFLSFATCYSDAMVYGTMRLWCYWQRQRYYTYIFESLNSCLMFHSQSWIWL